jgi:tetratricopeptide (TPR) repeat protein
MDPGSSLDREIVARIEALRVDPGSPALHNELGALLFERSFPKDARYEFERALKLDKKFYPARYNLALAELAAGNIGKAERQLKKLLDQKPGHPEGHFTLGLLYEQRGRRAAAIDHYARAYSINRELLDPKKNPRIVESQLVTYALLASYDSAKANAAVTFHPAPAGYVPPKPKEEPAPAEQAPAAPAEQPQPATEPQPVTPPQGR